MTDHEEIYRQHADRYERLIAREDYQGNLLPSAWIRTDYQFSDVDEAEELVAFFFGEEMARWIADEELTVIPECNGIWWLRMS